MDANAAEAGLGKGRLIRGFGDWRRAASRRVASRLMLRAIAHTCQWR